MTDYQINGTLKELVTTMRQIRDELREMNGKDAEGNRKPDISYYGGVATPDGTPWEKFDHQGENTVE